MSNSGNGPDAASPAGAAAAPIVDGRGLGKTFGTLTALTPLDIVVRPGERVALAGPSGSGKTTLLHILAGLLPPDRGQLYLDSRPLAGLQPGRELSGIVGLVRQQLDLVPQLPVVQNVLAGRLGQWGFLRSLSSLFSARERGAAFEALSRLGIADKIDERTSRLSGGEQQRVGIARALVKNPSLVLADEPTGNLDSRSSEEILAILQRLNQQEGLTVIIVTHEPDIAAATRRIISMRDGEVIGDEPVLEPRQAAPAGGGRTPRAGNSSGVDPSLEQRP